MGERITANVDFEVIESKLSKLPAVSFIALLDGGRVKHDGVHEGHLSGIIAFEPRLSRNITIPNHANHTI
jgi:hypothetical protein